jgi:hypothetical protein
MAEGRYLETERDQGRFAEWKMFLMSGGGRRNADG